MEQVVRANERQSFIRELKQRQRRRRRQPERQKGNRFIMVIELSGVQFGLKSYA